MRYTALHPSLGVQVHDFDLENGGSPEEIAELRAALDKNYLLLFRGGGRISPERHLEIANWFGPPGPAKDIDKYVSVLDNEEASGALRLPFHADFTYTDLPCKVITLHPLELPRSPTSTTFVSGVDAWTTLPEDIKERLKGHSARHYYAKSISKEDFPVFDQQWPIPYHHPRTGDPILFATEWHTDRIVGVDEEESRALLEQIFAHLYAEEKQYDHVWELHDFLIWDNVALQHARGRQAPPEDGKRRIQRVSLNELGYEELVERQRQMQAA